MQTAFYLSKDGGQVGPYSVDEIRKKLDTREHSWMDYVYDEIKTEWILLIEHPAFSEKYNRTFLNTRPATPTGAVGTKESKDALKDKAWFTLKNGSNFGPFSQLEMIQMLQDKALFEYDYVWHQSLPSWKRVAEVANFRPEKMRALIQENQAEVAEIFFRRRHLRAKYGCSLIVHNNKSVFRGTSFEISAGGAGVLIDSQLLNPDQTVFLHFQPGEGVPPFNAVCTIVSKQFVGDAAVPGEWVRYGIKFVSVSQKVKDQIRGFTETRKAG